MRSRIALARRMLVPASLVTILVVAAALWSQIGDGESIPDRVGSGAPGALFEWTMAPRFGLDVNADGRPDIPNTFEYVHNLEPGSCSAGCDAPNPEFTIELDASGAASDRAEIDQYLWEIRGDGLGSPIELRSAGSQAEVSRVFIQRLVDW